MDLYMDNYGYMRRGRTGKIYDWQVKGYPCDNIYVLCINNNKFNQ